MLLRCTCSMLCMKIGVHMSTQCANCILIHVKCYINSLMKNVRNMMIWPSKIRFVAFHWVDAWLYSQQTESSPRKKSVRHRNGNNKPRTERISSIRYNWVYLARICQEIVIQVALENNTPWNERRQPDSQCTCVCVSVIECVCVKRKVSTLSMNFPFKWKWKHRYRQNPIWKTFA